MEVMPPAKEVTTQVTFTYLLSNVAASSPSSIPVSIKAMMDRTIEVKLDIMGTNRVAREEVGHPFTGLNFAFAPKNKVHYYTARGYGIILV